jgi:Protein-tyrosine phosphatase
MPPKPQPPAWLLAAYKPEYLKDVLSALGQRETRRDVARNASRRKSDPSVGMRLQQYLKKAGATPEQIDHYSVTVGASKENEDRNRYLQLEPYNRTRVIVGADDLDGTHQSDASQKCGGMYLNASFVLEKYGKKWWIATQVHSYAKFTLLIADKTSGTPPKHSTYIPKPPTSTGHSPPSSPSRRCLRFFPIFSKHTRADNCSAYAEHRKWSPKSPRIFPFYRG